MAIPAVNSQNLVKINKNRVRIHTYRKLQNPNYRFALSQGFLHTDELNVLD